MLVISIVVLVVYYMRRRRSNASSTAREIERIVSFDGSLAPSPMPPSPIISTRFYVCAFLSCIICVQFFVYLDFLALLESERSDHVSTAPRYSVYTGSLCTSHFWVASEKCKHASLADIAGTRLLRPSHRLGSIFQDILLTRGGDFVYRRVLFF